MMRGATFVVFEVLLWMVVALLIGVVIGWLIRGWRNEEKLRARLLSESPGPADPPPGETGHRDGADSAPPESGDATDEDVSS